MGHVGHHDHVVRALNVLAANRASKGDLDTAADEAPGALAIARRTGNPGLMRLSARAFDRSRHDSRASFAGVRHGESA